LYYSPPQIRLPTGAGANPEIVQRARAALTDAVVDEGRALLPEALRATVHTIVGTRDPRQGIVLAADGWLAELIVVGARARRKGGFGMRFLGSVAKSVAHAASAPVLVVRSDGETQPGPLRVLVAFDGLADSRQTAPFLKQLTWPEQTTGRVMTVVTPYLDPEYSDWLARHPWDSDAEALAATWAKEHQVEARRRRDDLIEFSGQLPQPFRHSEPIVTEGQPAERILETVEKEAIDLVVVGAKNRSVIDRLLMGSTSDTILSHAHCSVLIVRERPQP
ncbi:MAG TPA: universal stress protein, partial [Pirellulales bacterium]|nr:universal stress protein [Pirellulales bacterium]